MTLEQLTQLREMLANAKNTPAADISKPSWIRLQLLMIKPTQLLIP